MEGKVREKQNIF